MFYAPLPRNLEAALRDIADPKVRVRVSAARDVVAHAEAAPGRVIAALEKGLSDSNALVRAACAEALGDIKGKEALSALLVAIEDEHQIVRQAAIIALGEIGDSRAQQRLQRALEDERADVRFQAVMAFARVASSSKDALDALVRASKDKDELVAHIAFRMAEELTEDARGEVAPVMLDRARASLGHASPKVRAVAAVLLATAGDSSGHEILIAVIEGRVLGAEPEDIASAIEIAGEKELKEARPALERRAHGNFLGLRRDPFSWHAGVALARMGDERSKKNILSELSARSFQRRTLAVSAAGRARLSEAKSLIAAMKGRPERAEPEAVEAALELLEASQS